MKRDSELRWNLDDIMPADKFDEWYKEIEKDLEEIGGYWKKLEPEMSEDDFGKLMEFEEGLIEKVSRLGYLPHLMEAADQKDRKAKLLKSKANNLLLQYREKIRKISHWLKGLETEGKEVLDDENAKRLFVVIKDLRYGLSRMREAAKHTLSQKEENVISNKDVNGIEALKDLRQMIETEFVYRLKIKDQRSKIIKTQAELLALTHSVKKGEREVAYRALLEKQKENIDKLFLVYQAAVKDWGYEAKMRGFGSPIAVRNFDNHISDKAVETLLTVCQENKNVFGDYFKWKAKKLGDEKLSRFDLYAPIEGQNSKIKNQNLEKVRELVLESFCGFSEKFGELAKKVWQEKHIDSKPREGKRGGAFCATVGPKITPYVMLNHVGTSRDVFTMAHELGHAVHSLYANGHYPSAQQANLPLAETASTLGEMVLFEKMLEKEKQNKIGLLTQKLDDVYATILRQVYFVLFEIRAHEEIVKGITVDRLSEIWMDGLLEQFGKEVMVDPLFAYEWGYISHIVESPFYCYAYAFGELLTISLYARYKNEGVKFLPKIEAILTAGGSESPEKILKEMGVDINSKDFWEDGFEMVKKWTKMLDR